MVPSMTPGLSQATSRDPVCSPEQLAPILRTLLDRDVPGLSIAVVEGDQVRWSTAAGLADLATHRPVTPLTAYLWFSMTKIVTATAVMQLVDRGRLALDDPVSGYLPAVFPPARGTGYAPLTIRHLLNHSSGLPNPLPIGWVRPVTVPAPEARAFMQRLLERHARRLSPPGVRASYSNLGYLVLGEVIAAAAGLSYEDFVRENLLRPLGMRHTDFLYTTETRGHAATGYHKRWNVLTPLLPLMVPRGIIGPQTGRFLAFHPFYVDGAVYGGLVGPVEDAARFLRLHLHGGQVEGTRLLSAEAVAAMQSLSARGSKLDVGLGWFRLHTDSRRDDRHLEHLGGGAGFFNVMRIYPDRSLGIVVMGNASSYDHRRLLDAVRGKVSGPSRSRCPCR